MMRPLRQPRISRPTKQLLQTIHGPTGNMAHILLYMATFQTILSKLYMAHFLAATTEPLSILSLLVCSRPTQAPFLASGGQYLAYWPEALLIRC